MQHHRKGGDIEKVAGVVLLQMPHQELRKMLVAALGAIIPASPAFFAATRKLTFEGSREPIYYRVVWMRAVSVCG